MDTSYTCHDLIMAGFLPEEGKKYLENLMLEHWNAFLAPDDIPPKLPTMDILTVFHALALLRKDIAIRKIDARPWDAQMSLMMALIQGVEFLTNNRGMALRENLARSNRGRALLMVPHNLSATELGEWYKDPDLYYEYIDLQYDLTGLL